MTEQAARQVRDTLKLTGRRYTLHCGSNLKCKCAAKSITIEAVWTHCGHP
jgi:hypothetical protein